MFKFFKRQRLVQKGLACGKTRATGGESELAESLETGWIIRIAIFALFVAGIGVLISIGPQEEPLKRFLLSLLILGTAAIQMWIGLPDTLNRNSRLFLVLGVIFVQLTCVRFLFLEAANGHIPASLAPLLVPYSFAPLVLSVLLGRNHGIFAAIFCSLLSGMLTPTLDPVFLVLSLITGFIAVYATLQVRRRSRLIRAGIYTGIATWVLAFTFGLIGPFFWFEVGSTDWRMIGLQSIAALSLGIGTAIIATGVIPMLENLFHITTDISWLESADLNHPLLQRLSIEAPGTYHHSLAVANLAEAAAKAVDANPTICRVCAYFHDIGKLVKPEYFVENMRPGENPHDDLTPTMSALIIISHVKEGVDLAVKHKLNQRIVDAIRQHHGTSLVSYFYHRAKKQEEDARLGGKIMNLREDDIPEVKESSFRYPGPLPQTREIAIVSLADAVESASRSMEKPTPQRIEELIQSLISERIADHQLDESPLTLAELKLIARSFQQTLMGMLHSRIAYPKKEKEKEEPERHGHGAQGGGSRRGESHQSAA